MKKYLFILSLLVATNAFAQDKNISAIENHVSELMDAMVQADEAKLNKLTSASLSYGHSNGLIESQSEYIEALTSGTSNFTEIKIEDQSVEVVKDVALVRHHLIGTTHNTGADPAPVDLGVLMVWQKNGRDWVLLARQAFKW